MTPRISVRVVDIPVPPDVGPQAMEQDEDTSDEFRDLPSIDRVYQHMNPDYTPKKVIAWQSSKVAASSHLIRTLSVTCMSVSGFSFFRNEQIDTKMCHNLLFFVAHPLNPSTLFTVCVSPDAQAVLQHLNSYNAFLFPFVVLRMVTGCFFITHDFTIQPLVRT
jgi:hypothetical protein